MTPWDVARDMVRKGNYDQQFILAYLQEEANRAGVPVDFMALPQNDHDRMRRTAWRMSKDFNSMLVPALRQVGDAARRASGALTLFGALAQAVQWEEDMRDQWRGEDDGFGLVGASA